KESINSFIAQAHYIHHFATHEVLQFSNYLRFPTIFVRTVMHSSSFLSHKLTITFRTMLRIDDGKRTCRPFAYVYTHYFWDDFSTLFHVNGISLMQVKARYLIGIVQGCAFYGSTCQQNRLEVCHGCDCSSTPDLISHFFEDRFFLRCFKFIGCRPPRRFGG